MVDGVPHRMRRGKLVPIPEEWVGQTAHPQSIRKRPSKQIGKKNRKEASLAARGKPISMKQTILERLAKEELDLLD